jgi:signal transduction histidine kinase
VAAVAARRREAISGPGRVWLLTATLAVATGLTLTITRFASPPQDGPTTPWWFLAIGFGVAEVFVIHLRIRRHAHSFALSEIPLVLGLVFSTPGAVILAQAVGVGIVLATYRRQTPLRLSFNVTQRSFTAVLAVFVFHGTAILTGGAWPSVWLAAFAAAAVADVVGAILINMAISLSEGVWEIFDEVVGAGTAFTVANTGLALVAAMAVQQQPAAILLVALPAATTFLAGRAYAEVQLKHDNVVLLQRSTRLAQGSLQLAEMLPALLQHIREMFHADVAELTLWPDAAASPYLCSRVGPGEENVVLEPADPDPTEGVWARVAAEREGVLLSRPIRNDRLAAHFAARGIVDSIVVPVMSEDEVLGTMMVANRLGDFSTFGPEDLKLLDALGNHVGVAIRNTRLVNRLEVALAHETEMSKIKDDFVATISHELRTPLTNVKGYLRTLLGPIDLPTAEQRDFLERADRATDRLHRLIEDLLFASSVESSRARPAPEIVSPSLVIEQLVDERRSGPRDRGRIDASVDPDLPAMRTYEEHVRRIVGNLLDNALKYSPPTEQVTIVCRHDGGGVLFAVRDRGSGIPTTEQDRVFDRFYQVDQSLTRRVGGTGMGLYIARRAAEVLGGRVWLERSGATGSTFCAWLPLEAPSAGGVPLSPQDESLVIG